MSYYFATKVGLPFDDAVQRTIEALKREGFGIISDIDVSATFKKKIDVDFRPYRILCACNPSLAHQALQVEDKAGTMLPCNVIVQDLRDGVVEIAAIDPVASMEAIPNQKLRATAAVVRERLQRVVASL